jgi:hypothetical protein
MVAFFFEVMDKEPWIWDIWIICLPVAVPGYLNMPKAFPVPGGYRCICITSFAL